MENPAESTLAQISTDCLLAPMQNLQRLDGVILYEMSHAIIDPVPTVDVGGYDGYGKLHLALS